jgi:hypothetical protein
LLSLLAANGEDREIEQREWEREENRESRENRESGTQDRDQEGWGDGED